jgi:circadian clock protein KaiC
MHGEMRRGITVLKMRGSMHDKEIREFTIDGRGMHVGKPFREIAGILSGQFIHVPFRERETNGTGAVSVALPAEGPHA